MCAKDGGSAVVSYVGMGLFFSCCGLRELLVLSDDVGHGVPFTRAPSWAASRHLKVTPSP